MRWLKLSADQRAKGGYLAANWSLGKLESIGILCFEIAGSRLENIKPSMAKVQRLRAMTGPRTPGSLVADILVFVGGF
ncbi:hypothetical protein I7I48_11061 [Histoplasma ohiense]|nr:hypothetical protein I7I48_11061 [Histoplasma ohiense (nom. inval.)]